jgi:methyl-accepting chemotaxis protein
MLKKLQKFNIPNKLLVILFGVIITLSTSIALFYSHIQTGKELDKITFLTISLKSYFMKLERHDQKFRNQKSKKISKQFTRDFLVSKKLLNSLKRKVAKFDLSRKYINEFQRRIDKYGFTFDNYSKYELFVYENGNNIETLQSSKSRLYNNIDEMRAESLLKDVLILELDEKEFLTYRENFHIKKFMKNFESFLSRIKKYRHLSNKARKELIDSAEDYQRIFSSTVEILSKSHGITFELNDLITGLYITADDMIKATKREIHEIKKNSQLSKLLIIGILTTILIIFSIFTILEIRRSINRLKAHTLYFGKTFDLTKNISIVGDNEIDNILNKLNVFVSSVRHELKAVKEVSNVVGREIERVTTLNVYLKDRADNFDVEAGEKRSMVSELSVVKNRNSVILDELSQLLKNSLSVFEENTNLDQCSLKIDEVSENNFEVNRYLDELNKHIKDGNESAIQETLSKTFSAVIKTSNSISSTRGNFLKIISSVENLVKNINDMQKRFGYLKENGEDFQEKLEHLLKTLSNIEDTLAEFSKREREGLKHIYLITDTNNKLKERLHGIRV